MKRKKRDTKENRKETPKSFLQRNFKESISFIKETRNSTYSIMIIFLIFALMGLLIEPNPETKTELLKFIQTLIEQTKDMGAFEITKFIFLNNMQSSFLGIFAGTIFGIFPIFAALSNGYILGFVANITVQKAGSLTLWRLFPHGIFELPAIFISFGIGLYLGSFITRKNKTEFLKTSLIKATKTFIFIIFPLLLIAAIIEGILIIYL